MFSSSVSSLAFNVLFVVLVLDIAFDELDTVADLVSSVVSVSSISSMALSPVDITLLSSSVTSFAAVVFTIGWLPFFLTLTVAIAFVFACICLSVDIGRIIRLLVSRLFLPLEISLDVAPACDDISPITGIASSSLCSPCRI